MQDIHFYWDKNMDTSRYAERYRADGTQYEKEKWYEANPSSLVLTTVGEYGKFGVAILKGKYLTSEIRDEMIKTQALLKNGKEYGLGWNLIKNLSSGGYALTHTGRNRGQNTVIILLPQVKKGIVVFTNGENGDKLYERIISEYFDTGKEILERMR